MGSDIPKQYLSLGNRAVISHTLQRVAQVNHVAGILVGLSQNDSYWPEVSASTGIVDHIPVESFVGGNERADTVLNGLRVLESRAADNDWVMVHDAARPCVRLDDMENLFHSIRGSAGGILAIPVADTVKRADTSGRVIGTVPRNDLWRALTPQVFRYAALRNALQSALNDNILITDEASAMEHTGVKPLLVRGHADNIKITHQEDLKMAELFLSLQESLA